MLAPLLPLRERANHAGHVVGMICPSSFPGPRRGPRYCIEILSRRADRRADGLAVGVDARRGRGGRRWRRGALGRAVDLFRCDRLLGRRHLRDGMVAGNAVDRHDELLSIALP